MLITFFSELMNKRLNIMTQSYKYYKRTPKIAMNFPL